MTDQGDGRLFGSRSKGSSASQEPQSQGPSPASDADPAAEYNMNHANRGLFIIFNQVEFDPPTGQDSRLGSDIDASFLETTFRSLYFDVQPYLNLSRKQIFNVLEDLQKQDHSNSDCIGIAILSHGKEDAVYAKDETLTLVEISRMLRADKCPSLSGKPKLFFVQACRGDKFDGGFPAQKTDSGSKNSGSVSRIPLESDFYFFYSAPLGYFSWRNDREGSWFVQQLCSVLQQYGSEYEFTQLMLTVQRRVAEYSSRTGNSSTEDMKQIPASVSQLRKLLYFRNK